jgi:Transport and Golgi organisation 2
MCTLTWRHAAEGGYDLWFNRDERDSRQPEQAPRFGVTSDGVRYLAPVDGDHGGTWLLLNAHGLTVALLNFYPRGVVEVGQESRGALPLLCASCACACDGVTRIRELPLQRYAPLHLVAIDAQGGAVHLRWDGGTLHEAAAAEFLTSSSFEPERVQAVRQARFEAWSARTAEAFSRFHQQHDPAAGAESVCMRRSDASTRSICSVRVRPGSRELTYQPTTWTGAVWPASQTLRL